ncbi:MAG TPA: hypothetical protein VL334_26435 [Anaerolineae bacterium]|nr:hypothetical protein [Anaerolineae bacterium]
MITVVNEIVHVNVPYTPWTEPAEAVMALAEIRLTASGPQPASLLVQPGDIVQWVAEVDGLTAPELLAAQFENPSLHPLSTLNPISSTLGWDGGQLQPGQVYRRQVDQTGRFTYTDGLGNEAEVCVSTCSPLAVTLAAFEATAQPGHILVSWETVSEFDNAGFRLYRSLDGDWDSATLLGFIPSQAAGSTQGAAYTWQDFDVAVGQMAWYWLEDIDVSGAAALHGPVSTILPVPTAVKLSHFAATAPRSRAAEFIALAVLLLAAVVWPLVRRSTMLRM